MAQHPQDKQEKSSPNDKARSADTEGYAALQADRTADVDPLKDLNLPGSYDEVLERLRRLKGCRDMEVLN
ncbi:MAG: hypothetical protein KIT10_02425 [Flavobacteriales bacterium]|nr:hypothetical protein [Flavobacteriales bacterium]